MSPCFVDFWKNLKELQYSWWEKETVNFALFATFTANMCFIIISRIIGGSYDKENFRQGF